MAMIASSTRSPKASINEPSVMRSKSLPVAAMTMNTAAKVRGTAAATTMPTRHHAEKAHEHHHAEGDEKLDHELVDGCPNVDRLVRNLGQAHAQRHLRVDRRRFHGLSLAKVEAVPPLTHDHAEQQGRFAVVAD